MAVVSMDILHSSIISITATILSLLFCGFIFHLLTIKVHGKKRYHPIGGTIFNQLINFHRLHHYMTDLAGKYKTYRLISPFRNEIYTSDPANVEYILKTNFVNYGKGWYNYSILKDLFGDGIFTVNGDKWQGQRKLSSHEFSTRVLRDFSSAVFRRNVAKLAHVLSEAANSNTTVDIQEKVAQEIKESTTEKENATDITDFAGNVSEDALEKMQCLHAALTETIRLYPAIPTGWHSYSILKDLLGDGIFTVDGDKWREQRKLSSHEFSTRLLRDFSSVVFRKNAAKFAHILSELVKSNKIVDIQMQYLHAALTETLRLYPAVPVDTKLCFSDDTLPDGSSVNKGDTVSYLPYAMGGMKFIWGDDAEEYKPERWLDGDGFFRPENPFKFTAFQAGPRICLGKEFSYRQMKIFSAVLLSYFVFKLSDDKKTINYRTMTNLHIDGGLHARVFRR
ncbi:hypothetical protein KY285_003998 [Solanum tuberosum]|nr:hypothetical protein KY285_003998 [Solanum tuberosum]